MAFGDTIIETVLGKPTVPEDTDNTPKPVAEGAAVNTTVGITAHSTFADGNAGVDYSLSADSSGGGFKIEPSTGVVTVADPSKIDFESAPGHAYTITVLATENNNFSSDADLHDQRQRRGALDAGRFQCRRQHRAEGAANGTAVGVTASSTDVNGPGGHLFADRRHLRRRLHHQCRDRRGHRRRGTKIDYETAPGHAYTVTAQASDGTLTSSQTFTISVSDVALTTPVDSNAAANSVVEGAAAGTDGRHHRVRDRSERTGVDLFADRRHLRRRLHHQCRDRRRHGRRSHQDRFRESARRPQPIPSPCRPATAC